MPVDFRHPEYRANLRRWRIARAVCGGEDDVKDIGQAMTDREFGVSPGSTTGLEALTAALGSFNAAATGMPSYGVSWEILPPLSGHRTVNEYWLYVQHAHFFPAAARAREGMVGLLVKDDPTVDAPAAMDPFVKDVTSSGSPQDVSEFSARVIFEIMTTGRAGILTDYPPRPKDANGKPLPAPSVKEAEAKGIKPRWKLYPAEQIINWRMDRVRERDVLGLVVLEEDLVLPPGQSAEDEFAWVPLRQWRVLDRAVPPPEAGKLPFPAVYPDGKVCRVRFYTMTQNGIQPSEEGDLWPLVNGALSEEIPFEFVGARDCTPRCDKPPLYDVVTVNVGHYRNSAALEHALYFTANPMAYVLGYDAEEEQANQEAMGLPAGQAPQWRMGSGTMFVMKSEKAQLGVLSASAAELSGLAERIAVKREELATIVGRILATDKKAAEAAQTEKIRRQGEQGVLASLANNVGDALSRCLARARDYMGVKGDVSVEIPTQFWDTGITALEATAIADLWLKYGVIAKSDVREQLRDSGFLTRSDEDIDAELALDGVPTAPPGFMPSAPPLPGAQSLPVGAVQPPNASPSPPAAKGNPPPPPAPGKPPKPPAPAKG